MPAGREFTPAPTTDAPADEANKPINPLSSRTDAPVGSTIERARQPVWGQGIIVSLIAAAMLLILAILAVREHELSTGIPATETTTPLFWGIAILFTVLVGVGAQYSEISAARSAAVLGHPRRKRDYPTAWIVPVAGMFAAILLVATLHSTAMFVLGPIIAGFAVGGSLFGRDLLDDATAATMRSATTVHATVIHIVGLLGLTAVYLNKMSLWVGIPLVAIFTFLLFVENLDRGLAPMQQRVFYAFLGSIVISIVMVFLNWWLTWGWVGGAVLFVAFAIIAGIFLAQTTRDGLQQRDLIKFLGIGAIALVILIILM